MIFKLLLLFIPVSLILEYAVHPGPVWVFLTAVVAIVPLAEFIRESTEHLAERLGSAIGGLLNVTFGNMKARLASDPYSALDSGSAELVKSKLSVIAPVWIQYATLTAVNG